MSDVICPTCGSLIRLRPGSGIGQFVTCPVCQNVFNLVSINPAALEKLNFEWNLPQEKNDRRENKFARERFQHSSMRDDRDDLDEYSSGRRTKKAKKRDAWQ